MSIGIRHAHRMMARPGSWFRVVAGVGLTLVGHAAAADPPVVSIPRVADPPALADFATGTPPDGLLRVDDFRQREPGDGVPASQPTIAYLGYDADNLYVVFVCRDDPTQVRAHLTKREAIFGDDLVGVVLDTFRDRRRAYVFLTNPLGIQLDETTAEGQNDDPSFDTLWHSEGRVTPDGYLVRFALPFKSLRFSNAPTQTWGIALGRIIPRNNETSFWPYITRRIASFGQQLATLEGLEQISPGRNVQVIPYGTFTSARFLDGSTVADDTRGRVGLDVKMVFRDAVTLDLALNPDFSQVESDEPQVTINQRFEVFFPEKRPFFIENASLFQTPQNLFFSRRVADPQFGARVTGKAGPWVFAGLAIDDQAAGQGLQTDDPGRNRRAGTAVARLQREFATQSSLGVLVTSRDFLSASNRVASADLRLKLSENWYFTGQATASRTTTADDAELSGPAYDAELWYGSRRFRYSLEYVDRSPGFRTSLGFIPRVDMRRVGQFVRYSWFPGRHGVVSVGPSMFSLVNWDHHGVLQDWEVSPEFHLELKGNTWLEVGQSVSMERFETVPFRQRATSVWFSTEWFAWLSGHVNYRAGTRVNYFPAPGLEPFVAVARRGGAGVTLRPSSRLRLEETYLLSRLTTPDDWMAPAGSPGSHIFDNHILRSRVDYQFTRELSLRAILDYTAVLPNRALVALDTTKQFKADLLLTYLVNPWTAFYVGYSDAYENFASDPFDGLRRIGGPGYSTGRQFFVKSSYLVRR